MSDWKLERLGLMQWCDESKSLRFRYCALTVVTRPTVVTRTTQLGGICFSTVYGKCQVLLRELGKVGS